MGAVKGSGRVTDQALAEAFYAFEGENGRQASVIAVGDSETKSQAQAAVNSGVVGGLTVEFEAELSGWELRGPTLPQTDEQMAQLTDRSGGLVNPYPALAAEHGPTNPAVTTGGAT